jgi:hypothetical protein
MRPLWILLAALCLCLPRLVAADEVIVTCSDPLVFEATDPSAPSVGEGAPGGIDAGLIGDSDRVLLGTSRVGKTYYGTNDSLSLRFIATGPVTVEIGHLPYEFGCREGIVQLDGTELARFPEHLPHAEPATTVLQITGTGRVQTLTIRPADDSGYVTLDALRLSAEGPVRIVDAAGRPALVASAALPPAEAAAAATALDRARDLATPAQGMTYRATDEWGRDLEPTGMYSAGAGLDGAPSETKYWAGTTPPPHTLLLTWPQKVRFDTNRIVWLGTNRGVWYTLECWDGARWRSIYNERRNVQATPIYRFPPVTTDRVRLTILTVTGQPRVLMTAFGLYELGGGDAR